MQLTAYPAYYQLITKEITMKRLPYLLIGFGVSALANTWFEYVGAVALAIGIVLVTAGKE
jgi:hypothetical protein